MTLQRKGYIQRKAPLKPSTPKKRKPGLSSPKRTTPPTKSELKALCDSLARNICRYGKPPRCERCQRTPHPTFAIEGEPIPFGQLQWAHIHPRGYLATRWLEENCLLLCVGCHMVWAENHPLEFDEWAMEKIGQEEWYRLRFLALAGARGDVKVDYPATLARLHARALELGVPMPKIPARLLP